VSKQEKKEKRQEIGSPLKYTASITAQSRPPAKSVLVTPQLSTCALIDDQNFQKFEEKKDGYTVRRAFGRLA